MTASTAAYSITEAKFQALKQKLRELFELDKSDLDFGIYRIMAAKNEEVTAFLDRQLRDVVRDTLAGHESGVGNQIQAELQKALEQAKDLGVDPSTLPKVQELEAKLKSAGGASAEELEADIYNHLLAFFSRYYDEGDFISKRRYKGDVYAIPYSGEEVVLHWANKDQYYIKSGEWHKDYRFKVGGGSGKTARIRLLQATQEAGNNKEADDSKRRFILCADNPIDAEHPDELTIHFEFRVPTEEEKRIVTESEATRIFGGKYDKARGRTKGDEREQFAAYAEKVALEAMPESWKELVGRRAATDAKPDRTIFGKHLDDFTARNTFDYFIHKDLGGFLGRELDHYIKNDVVRLDDLEALDEDQLSRVQGRLKAIRLVGGRIIKFLASVEDFQRRLWLKKKLVLSTNWLVTIDRVPEYLRDTVVACVEQWSAWEAMGFRPPEGESGGLFGDAQWGTREYLDACEALVLDTIHFDDTFKADLLASETIVGEAGNIDAATTGVLIHGDNFQSQRLLREVLRARVRAVYFDPPYNTSELTFTYKNMYKHSSWASMLYDRVADAAHFMSEDACLQLAIDDAEYHRAKAIVDLVFGEDNYLGTLAIETNPRGRGINAHYATSHDYIICSSRDEASVDIADQPLTEEQAAGYPGEDGESQYRLLPFRRSGGLSTPDDRPNSEFALFVDPDSLAVRGVGGARSHPYPKEYEAETALVLNDSDEVAEVAFGETAKRGLVAIMPIDSSGARRVWRWSDRRKILRHAAAGDFVVQHRGGTYSVQLKDRIKAGRKPKTMWFDSKYDASSHGTNLVRDIIGERGSFGYPKSFYNTHDALHSVVGDDTEAIVVDSFAGSGTTGHAVIEMNRGDDGSRRFVLTEAGAYFGTVLKPRIAKVLYSPEWKEGRAQRHGAGQSGLIKYFTIESYEDALCNLPAPGASLLDALDDEGRDALMRYSLDLDLGPHLLDLDVFRDPWGNEIEAQSAGEEEVRRQRVDLVETFNYLLGLKVHAYGRIERYSAEFDRSEHDDDLGRVQVVGRFRRDPEGLFVFQRIEGELNDGNNTRVLVIWRTLTDDPEQDAAALDAWMDRHREDTRERSEHRDYHRIYVNGPVTLAQPTQEIRTVFPIEQTFKDRMFADTDGSEAV